MILKSESSAAMGEPPHDEAVTCDRLLAVDAEVLARLCRAARHGEAPGDERAGVERPAGLHRQPREIDVLSFPHDFLAGRRGALARRHVEHLLEERELVPQVAQAL